MIIPNPLDNPGYTLLERLDLRKLISQDKGIQDCDMVGIVSFGKHAFGIKTFLQKYFFTNLPISTNVLIRCHFAKLNYCRRRRRELCKRDKKFNLGHIPKFAILKKNETIDNSWFQGIEIVVTHRTG